MIFKTEKLSNCKLHYLVLLLEFLLIRYFFHLGKLKKFTGFFKVFNTSSNFEQIETRTKNWRKLGNRETRTKNLKLE